MLLKSGTYSPIFSSIGKEEGLQQQSYSVITTGRGVFFLSYFMERYEYVFDVLGSIVVDIQIELIESEDDSQKALARLERSYLSQVVDLLHEARRCRQLLEKES